MAIIAASYKAKLSEIIGAGHKQFGRVALRRPYKDDEEGGSSSGLQLEEHPLLAQQQIGAPDDMNHNTLDNSEVLDEARDEKINELCYQLKNQNVIRAALGAKFNPKPGFSA